MDRGAKGKKTECRPWLKKDTTSGWGKGGDKFLKGSEKKSRGH